MQYAHHYGTVRDVQKGAMNLKTFEFLDRIWLNHNWHLNHHMSPTVPWVYLPPLSEPNETRGGLVQSLSARMARAEVFPTNTWRIAMQEKSLSKDVRPPSADAFPDYPASWYLFCESRQLRDKPFSHRILGGSWWPIETASGQSHSNGWALRPTWGRPRLWDRRRGDDSMPVPSLAIWSKMASALRFRMPHKFLHSPACEHIRSAERQRLCVFLQWARSRYFRCRSFSTPIPRILLRERFFPT